MITKEKVLDIIDEEFFLLIRHLNNNMVAQNKQKLRRSQKTIEKYEKFYNKIKERIINEL